MTTEKPENGKLGFVRVYRLWTTLKSVGILVGKFDNSHKYLQLAHTIVMICSYIT